MSYFLKHYVIMTSVGVILRLNPCLKVLCWGQSEIRIFTHIDQVWLLTPEQAPLVHEVELKYIYIFS